MAQHMISLEESSHDDFSAVVGAHSGLPAVDFDTFAFLRSGKLVSNVGTHGDGHPGGN